MTEPTLTVPPVPPQVVKRRRFNQKWLMRVVIAVVMLIPFIAIAIALVVVHGLHQPQSLHRTHITPVAPTAATSTNKS